LSVHLVIPDPHAHPKHHNERADWLGRLILDLKPDVVINMGDQFDMPSLSSYDKGKRDFEGRTYAADINAGLDFSERLFTPVRRARKKRPRRVYIEGNHDNRIERALDLSPELVGTISFNDYDLKRDYDDVVRYNGNTPGIINIDGVNYSHFLVSGVMGRPIGGEHPAYTLISKQFQSCTVAHTHVFDYCVRSNARGGLVMGLVAGCYLDYRADWAGEINNLWVRGVAICRNVEGGSYDLQWVSMEALKKEYGNG
jgi:hypothetical protein